MKCASGRHEWTDKQDADKCCNGFTRILVFQGGPFWSKRTTTQVEKSTGAVYGRAWVPDDKDAGSGSICSAHQVRDPSCPQCNATPADLLGKKTWERMTSEADEAGLYTCKTCGFRFYLTVLGCPACDSTATELYTIPEVMSRLPARRCKVTANPCGSDTWAEHHPCQCGECQAYLFERNACCACGEPFVRGWCHCAQEAHDARRDVERTTIANAAK